MICKVPQGRCQLEVKGVKGQQREGFECCYLGQCYGRAATHTHTVGHMLIKVGRWPVQDANNRATGNYSVWT